ncbi:hypothetical protein [Streptomyces coelicoflavus]|uniref:hypothetical protein n=1 Tax=Streptomyces coelicoflavus TaxID=285562 RepID=UPI002E25DB1F
MATAAQPRSPSPAPAPAVGPAVRRVPAVRRLGPDRYACVMGTAIVGAAGAALPGRAPGRMGLVVHDGLTVALYALLVAAWTVAAVRTARGLLSGALLAGPRPVPGAPRPVTARTT